MTSELTFNPLGGLGKGLTFDKFAQQKTAVQKLNLPERQRQIDD